MANPMDIQTFSQLGMGMATLLILWFVVKYFIDTLGKKDDYIKEIVKEFHTTINNHITHQTEQAKKETAALRSLTRAINTLVKKIEK
jgi:hypothetical protein